MRGHFDNFNLDPLIEISRGHFGVLREVTEELNRITRESYSAEGQSKSVDQMWRAVETQLLDQRWDLRTVQSIADATKLSEDNVLKLLREHSHDIRVAYFTDFRGRLLYTHSSRRISWREIFTTVRAFIIKRTSIPARRNK